MVKITGTTGGVAAEPQRLHSIAKEVFNAFVWNKTPQGIGYWNTVYENLLDLAKRAEKQDSTCEQCGQELKG